MTIVEEEPYSFDKEPVRMGSVPFLKGTVIEEQQGSDPAEYDVAFWPIPNSRGRGQYRLGIVALGENSHSSPRVVNYLEGERTTTPEGVSIEITSLEIPDEVDVASSEKGRRLAELISRPSALRIIPQPTYSENSQGTLLLLQTEDDLSGTDT